MNRLRRCSIYNSAIKGTKYATCSNIDGTRESHTKRSKSERERQIPCDITYIWNLIYITNEPLHRKETQTWRTDLWLPRERRRERGGRGVWGSQMQTIAFGVDTQ